MSIKFYIKAGYRLFLAQLKSFIGIFADEDSFTHRNKACEKCPLNVNMVCSADRLSDGNKVILIDSVVFTDDQIFNDGKLHQIVRDETIYTRGCGCNLNKKQKFHFTKKELETACVLNKWKI